MISTTYLLILYLFIEIFIESYLYEDTFYERIVWFQQDVGHYSQVAVDYSTAINSMIHMLLHFCTHAVISLNVTS